MPEIWNDKLFAPSHHKRRKITPQQADEIRERYADGETAKQLAAEFGVSFHTISQYVEARRPGAAGVPSRIPKATQQEIADRYKAGGITLRELGEQYGASISLIHKIVHSQ